MTANLPPGCPLSSLPGWSKFDDIAEGYPEDWSFDDIMEHLKREKADHDNERRDDRTE